MELSEAAGMRLAENITSMTYGELKEICKELSEMYSDRSKDGDDFNEPDAWMDLLHSWANLTVNPVD